MATKEFNDYTELIHAGEGIEIEKGKISATGSGSDGGGVTYLEASLVYDESKAYFYISPTFSFNDVKNIIDAGRLAVMRISITSDIGDSRYISPLSCDYSEDISIYPYRVSFTPDYFLTDLGFTAGTTGVLLRGATAEEILH